MCLWVEIAGAGARGSTSPCARASPREVAEVALDESGRAVRRAPGVRPAGGWGLLRLGPATAPPAVRPGPRYRVEDVGRCEEIIDFARSVEQPARRPATATEWRSQAGAHG